MPESESEGVALPLLDYVQLLWFRKKLIIAITVFVGVIGYIEAKELQDIYSAQSTMLISSTPPRVASMENLYMPEWHYMRPDVDAELALLRSRTFAEKVVERLKLTNHPQFNPALREPVEERFSLFSALSPRNWIPQSWKDSIKEALGRETVVAPPPQPRTEDELEVERHDREVKTAASILLGGLSVSSPDENQIINVSYSSPDRQTAAWIANEVPESYLLDKLEARFESVEKTTDWLSRQLADLETKVLESERAVEIYRQEHGLSESAGGTILDAQLSELNSQLIIARSERAEVEARLEQLRRLLAGGASGAETAPEILSSTLIQQLRAQEAQTISRASELSLEYGPKHPRMLQVQAELREISTRIREEANRILVGLENEAEFTRARVASLEQDLRIAQGESSEQNKESIQLRALQREAAANRALYETFLNRFKETSTSEGIEQTIEARIISPAEVPGGPSYPNRRQIISKYVLAGFVGACGLVLLLQLLNPGLLNPEQVQRVLKHYVIGLIPITPGKKPPHEFVLEKPNSNLVEAINTLKVSLQLSDPDNPVKAVQITSSVPEEGKTTLAISLARVVASSGKKVLLIDGDLRRSAIGKKLNLSQNHAGLSDLVIAENPELADYLLRDEAGNVDFMPPGTARFANATDIFSSHRMESIIEDLKSRYDLVIVDTPPVMAVADARIIGRVVDKTIFVLRWEKTPGKVARAALEQLRIADVSVAGIVLQRVDLKRYGRVGYGDSGYYYHYGRYSKYYTA